MQSEQKSSPQPEKLDPLAEAAMHEQEAERLEKVALTASRPAAKAALELARSHRSAAALRKKQSAWEAESPQAQSHQLSNSPPTPASPPLDNQADFNL